MEILIDELQPRFINLFKNTIGLNDSEFDYFLTHFHKEYLPKKQFYLKEGQITCGKAYMNKGCTRTFINDENNKEHILFFAFEELLSIAGLKLTKIVYTHSPLFSIIEAIK